MSFVNTIKSIFGVGKREFTLQGCSGIILSAEEVFKEYALEICINKIANAISQCLIKVYENNKHIENDIWYKLTLSPNQNDSITEFWSKLLYQMIMNEDGALVILDDKNDFIIADSYHVVERAFKPNIYKNIHIKGYDLKSALNEEEVMRFKLSDSSIKNKIDNIYSEYGKLLISSIRNYNRNNATKIIVKIGSLFNQFKTRINPDTGKTEADMIMDDLMLNRLKTHMSESDSATPLEEGLVIEDVSKKNSNKAGSGETTRDIAAIFQDILNMVADALNIPRGLLYGDVADAEVMTDNFITFAINPIATIIETELNRKVYEKDDYLKGNKIKIRTHTVKGYDPTKIASSAEALYRIRSVNANWVRELLREERINEKWADEYSETKNYQSVNRIEKEGD